MAYTWKGTIYASTTQDSSVRLASVIGRLRVGQTYFNTTYGHVYRITEVKIDENTKKQTGWVTFKYVQTDIIGAPDQEPYALTVPNRGAGHTMTSSWKKWPWSLNPTNGKRAENVEVKWWVSKYNSKSAQPQFVNVGATSYSSSTFDFCGFTWAGKKNTRTSFYPLTKWKLHSVGVSVRYKNSKGYSKWVSQKRDLLKPRQPSVSAISFDNATGRVSATITTNAGTDLYERYDTRYKVTVKNTRTKKTWNASDSSSTATSFSVGYNVSDYQQLSYGEYVQVTITAWARGLAGDSKAVSRTIYVSYPAKTTISGYNVSSRSSSGKCTFYIKTNSTTAHPVDRVKLEFLANCEYATAGAIPGDANWTKSDIMDDASCNALTTSVGDLLPEAGNYTWARVKSYHLSEEVLYRYSEPIRIKKLETPAPTAVDERIKVLSATPDEDGKSIVVQLGWNASGADDSTGTELTWSNDADTWKSTKAPDKHEFTWDDGAITWQGVTYRSSAKITIKDLHEGETYYIRARRYMEGDTVTYSPYSNRIACVTSEAPESIVASCARYVSQNEKLTVRWSFTSNSLQTAWQIVTTSPKYIKTTDKNVASGKKYYTRSGSAGSYTYSQVANPTRAGLANYYERSVGAVIARGSNSLNVATITYARLNSFAENGSVSFNVQVSTGSGFITSEVHTVTLMEKPVLEISVDSVLREQPFSFEATCTEVSDLIVIVTAQGITSHTPSGKEIQTAGDTIHSNVYEPEWVAYELTSDTTVDETKTYYQLVDGEYVKVSDPTGNPSSNEYYEQVPSDTVTVTLPAMLDFWDTGAYDISVVAVDRTTGLLSSECKGSFKVEWTHQAVDPFDAVTITPINETDENGNHIIAAQIDLTPPEGCELTDVYDIYRLDGGNAHLIGEEFPLTYTVIDEYAPFGADESLYYRIALRTADGDVMFADKEYSIDEEVLRIDWEEGVLEFPYGLSVADSYSKSVDIRHHMDGSVDGYWNPNVERRGSLSTSVIKIVQPNDVEMSRKLARYAGPAFVRTPNGSAYEADVQITDLSIKNKAVTAISIDATEIGLTQEFMLPTPHELEEE